MVCLMVLYLTTMRLFFIEQNAAWEMLLEKRLCGDDPKKLIYTSIFL